MARISLMLGKNRDMPFTTEASLPLVAAGSAADYEVPHVTIPDLTKIGTPPSGAVGDLAINAVSLRAAYFMTATTLTGVVANNETFNILQRRNLGVNIPHAATIASGATVVTPTAGSAMGNIQVGTRLLVDTVASGVQETVVVTAVTATTFTATFASTHTFTTLIIPIINSPTSPFMALPVNTTSATTVVASTMAVTPLSMSNIATGGSLVFSAGTGAAETVTVLSTTATAFTATFVNGHSGAYTIVSAPLASLALNLTTVVIPIFTPILLNPISNFILGGDVLTLQRVSNNATGLAADTATIQKYMNYEFVPARIGR